MPSPYATGEDSKSLWIERSNYIATHIAAIAYGFHATIFFAIVYFMLHPTQTRPRDRYWVCWLLISVVLFVAGTITLACSIGFNEAAWVTERGYPSGPLAFLTEQQNALLPTVGDAAYIAASFLADGVLLYRVYIVWGGRWYVVVPLGLFYVTTVVLTVLCVLQLHMKIVIINLGTITWICIMVLNITLPATSALRILMVRRSIHRILGHEHSAIYTGAAAIVIETALPFVIMSAVLLVLFGGQNTTQYLFLPLLAQTTCIAPLLIILRSKMRSCSITSRLISQSLSTDKAPQRLPPVTFAATPSRISTLGVEPEQSTLENYAI